MMYIHEHVRQVNELHHSIICREVPYRTVREQLSLFAQNLYEAFQRGHPAGAIEISNYHPDWLGRPHEEILGTTIIPADCCLTIAREYGFPVWSEVEAEGNVLFHEPFEAAIDHLVGGEENALRDLLDRYPDLVKARSVYKHRAGLIHYIAANGVEIWRQRIPANLPALTQLLLDRGASPAMPHNIYGGTCSLLELVETSAHPRAAGVAKELVEMLGSEV